MDLDSGSHGSFKPSPQPLRTCGVILSAETSSYKVNPECVWPLATQHRGIHRKRCITGTGQMGFRVLLKWLAVDAVGKNDPVRYILETNTRISLLHLHSITPRCIFSSYSISLLFVACMDLDVSPRCSHKPEH